MRFNKKTIVFTLLILLILSKGQPLLAQVHFEKGQTWQQIKEKAKKEGKFIFVDCYATWCAPCKEMDREVYPDTAIGKFLNPMFLSLKVQMDTSKNDDTAIHSWYADAHQIMSDYKINSFPTSLFFLSDGSLAHKYIGFSRPDEFLRNVFMATDPKQQEYTLLKKFNEGKLPDSSIPELITKLERAEDKTAARIVAQKYIDNYLLKLPDELLFKKDNLFLIGRYLTSSTDKSFDLFYRRGNEVDKAVKENYAKTIVGNIILSETIEPRLWRDKNFKEPITLKPDWLGITNAVNEKYNAAFAGFLIPFEQIVFYKKTKQWPELIEVYMKKIEKEGVAGEDGENDTNGILYDIIFMHGTDKAILMKAANWSKIILDHDPNEPDYMDTYANLLYKSGQKKEAVKWEEKAINVKEDQLRQIKIDYEKNGRRNPDYLAFKMKQTEEIRTSLQNMKAGKPTWLAAGDK